MVDLRFGGSVWTNIENSLRAVDALYKVELQGLGLMVLEWYVLRALYAEDGQMANQLAKAVGRQATSFTPILDKIQAKGLIERRTHPTDRRSVKIYLTAKGKNLQPQVEASAQKIETALRKRFSDKEWGNYQRAVAVLQSIKPDLV